MIANTDKTEIALKQASTEVSSFVIDVEKEVSAIEAQFKSIVPDASNKDGYDYCKQVRKEVLPIKTGIENARRTLKAPIIKAGKLIDSSLNPLTARLEEVYKPFVDAYQKIDQAKAKAEEERLNKIQCAFDEMSQIALDAMGQSPDVIESIIEDFACFSFDRYIFQERTNEACDKHSSIMEKLSESLQQSIAHVEQQAQALEQQKIALEQAEKIADIERREQEINRREAIAEKADLKISEPLILDIIDNSVTPKVDNVYTESMQPRKLTDVEKAFANGFMKGHSMANVENAKETAFVESKKYSNRAAA
jgi:hypothetical protein